MALLNSNDDLREKIGAIRCLNRMVLDPFVFTYSSHPSDLDTPKVVAAWKGWWNKNEKTFPPLDPDRKEVLEQQFAGLAAETDRSILFEKLQDASFDRDDLPFFVEKLFESSALQERFLGSIILKLYIAEPLRLDVPLDAKAGDVADVAENWRVHYTSRPDEYR